MPAFPSRADRIVLEPDCARCPSLVDSRDCISWGVGSPDATIAVVGEAPGAGDPTADGWQGGNWTGMAYTSRHSGRAIRTLFADLGYESEDCYYTNAVKCFPSDGEGSNREPTVEELATCRRHLEAEIGLVEPQAIVATGRHATQSVLAADGRSLDGGFLDAVLEPIEHEAFGTVVLPILHPSYQAVWLSRLGFTREAYLDEIGSVLNAIDAAPRTDA